MTTFEMKAYKNGELVNVEVHNSGKYKRPKEYQALSVYRVVGVDTESRKYREKLTTVTTQIHLHDESKLIITADYEYAITAVFDTLFPMFAEKDSEHDTKQRARRTRKDGKICRDGSRKTIAPVLAVFYNLEYDVPRLFGNHPQFMRATTAEFDNVRVQIGDYEVEIIRCLLKGGAPSFEFKVRKEGQIFRLLGQDMWGYWKAGLDTTAKQLLGPDSGKDQFAKEDHEQTWEAFLLLSEEEQDKFFQYSRTDARLTRDIYLATVDLLMKIQPSNVQQLMDNLSSATDSESHDLKMGHSIVIRRDGTIPVSAPSAAARIAFAMGLPEWDLPKEWVYRYGAATYAGARVFNRRRSYVEDITVMDISSAYPHAMSILPDPARCKYVLLGEQPFDVERWKGQFGTMCVSGENFDAYYPCLRIHDLQGKRLRYVHGKFKKVWASIPEIVIGVISGRLRIDTIHTGCHIQGTSDQSFLRGFIQKVYQIKSDSPKDSPMYLMAKLLMNALYGKLVEIQVSTRWIDEKAHFEPVLAIPDLAKPIRQSELMMAYDDGKEGLDKLFDTWKKQYPSVTKTIPVIQVLKEKPAKSGQFYMPMHGAQITGFVSAKLGLAAHCTNALQGDTDSIFFLSKDTGGMIRYRELMLEAGYDAPETGLGSFELEVEGASGYLVKTKMYALKYEKKGEIRYKCANHGMRGVKSKEEAYILLETVMKEGEAKYSKKQVRKWLTAYKASIKSGEEVAPGEFFDQIVVIKAPNNPDQELDDKGDWIWKELGEEYVSSHDVAAVKNVEHSTTEMKSASNVTRDKGTLKSLATSTNNTRKQTKVKVA